MNTSSKKAANMSIRDEISSDLALRKTADDFFNRIESKTTDRITIDFSGVHSISRSFAQQYLSRKRQSRKAVTDINLPGNVQKMFEVVDSSKARERPFRRESFSFLCL